jgi:hypothetical protein
VEKNTMQNESINEPKQPESAKHSRFHELAQVVRKKIAGWRKQKPQNEQPTA